MTICRLEKNLVDSLHFYAPLGGGGGGEGGGVGGEKNMKLANPKIRLAAERIMLKLLFFIFFV